MEDGGSPYLIIILGIIILALIVVLILLVAEYHESLSKKLKNMMHGASFHDSDDVTEEEIISMVNEGHEQGVLLASEAEMIHNIFDSGIKKQKIL